MAKELIIDTTSKYLVVALADDKKVLNKIQYVAWKRQSEYAMKEIENILDKTNTKIQEIQRIIVSKGPGSYTGIRIALTIAKILGFALQIPACDLSSLQAMCGSKGKKIAILDARSNRAYIGIYDNGKEVLKDRVLTMDEIRKLVSEYSDYEIVGDRELLGLDSREIDYAEMMFELGKILPDCLDIDALKPIYLKETI